MDNKKPTDKKESMLAIPVFFIKLILKRLYFLIKGRKFKDVNSPEMFWDILASNFDRPKNQSESNSHIDMALEKAKQHLKNCDVVLDYGCAAGSDAIAISNLVKRVDGIDISSKMIAIANRRSAENGIKNVRFFTLPKFDNENKDKYDVIISLYVLHLIDDPQPVINKIYDLLVPGGIFISSTVCLGETKSFLGYLVRGFNKIGLIPELSFFQSSELVKIIEKERFKIDDKIDLKTDKKHKNFFIVARKTK